MYSCLSFLTDYGTSDGFVASCHGQFLRHAPDTRIVDITHQVPPGDIRRGAAILADTVGALPPAVHVAVVDPGVGTHRRSIAVRAGEHTLVGPDNGLLLWAATELGRAVEARELNAEQYWRFPVSMTFHGRDIYAPVAARLAAGLPLAEAGTAVDVADLIQLPTLRRSVTGERARGEVRTVDRFGNVQLSLHAGDLNLLDAPQGTLLEMHLSGQEATRHHIPVAATFASVPSHALLLLVDSSGYLALAANGADARQQLGLRPGDQVELCHLGQRA